MKTEIRTFMGLQEEYIVLTDSQEKAIREIVKEEIDKRMNDAAKRVRQRFANKAVPYAEGIDY